MTPAALAQVMQATWPPARSFRVGPWMLRDGQGGGQRVSATTAEAEWQSDGIALAEAGMADLRQGALFLIRTGDEALDAALEARGYQINDPVVAYAAPTSLLAGTPVDGMAAFAHWPPLAIACDIWARGGIGPERLAVMDRVKGPKAAILGRQSDHPSGVAFVAIADGVAMLHGLEVTPAMRRQGSAANILRAAAKWSFDQGATTFSLVVTEANLAARALYTSLGMEVVGHYHYRLKT